jgi:hypothetical protein
MTAKKTTKRNSKPRTAKPVTKPSTAVMSSERGHGGHKEGSRKSKVHELFNNEGPEAAWVLGLKLKLKENTLRSWFAGWKRGKTNNKGDVKANSSTLPIVKPDDFSATSEAPHP